MNYHWQYGRRYHAYKEGSYKFPNDEREQDRLDMLHNMFRLVLHGKVPPNVVFEVDDVESEWPSRAPFDFIHSRYMCGSIEDWPRLTQQAHDQLKPGGWIEFQEFHLVNYSEDGSWRDGNSVNRFYELLQEALDRINRPVTIGKDLKRIIEETGFVNVQHEVFQLPLGTWPRERRMKEIGALNMRQMLEGLEAFSAATKDARDRGVHMMHDL
ncbi:S-adenosyl-L-methionine-dependent methyltransferase [Aspergillus desertorum]